LPLPKGAETCLLQVIFLFTSPLAFNHLLKFICSFLFFSFSPWLPNVCVLSMHSSRGRLRTYVVRGPVDGCFLVWWVIDTVVWTDSWLSIAGASCVLTSVGAGEEQAWKVATGEASRCGEDK
jgi:hypothetical protein